MSYSDGSGLGRDDTTDGASGWADDEYHFTASDMGSRRGYSDAGYVPSDSATVPPRYHCAGEKREQREKRTRPPREKRGVGAAGLVAACLVCALLGSVGGAAIVGASLAPDIQAEQPAAGTPDPTVINVASSSPAAVETNIVPSGKELTATEIYELAKTRAVAITTEITYTNIFGYTSSGAVSGSGFIISANGYIITNYHVIKQAAEGGYTVNVLTYDGGKLDAEIVGYEEDNDIAVLKVDAQGLSAVTIGNSDTMQVGESVYAVGNPLGELEYTMTGGMVSALDRAISSRDSSTGTVRTVNMFQFDAAVNEGNSGGPLFNSRGEVIGVVAAKYSETGVEGLGFAIPINDAVTIANDIITNGYVTGKPYMGVAVQTVSSAVAQYYNMVRGAYVSAIEIGSCAETAGIEVGDIITSLGGEDISSESDLAAAKKAFKAGETAPLTLYRSGEYLELEITFDEQQPDTGLSSRYGSFD